MRTFSRLILTGLVAIITGCEQDYSRTPPSSHAPTGITPEAGTYRIHGNVGWLNSDRTFQVTSDGGIAGFAKSGIIQVKDGVFEYANGVNFTGDSDTGNINPTDGYYIEGHFTDSRTAEGSVSYHYGVKDSAEGPFPFTAKK
jgi:hypothetical protein